MPEHRDRGMLLAVDHGQRIIGADRAARATFLLDDEGLQAGVSLWTLFERDRALFRRHDAGDIATRLVIAGSDELLPTLVTPPDRGFSSARQDLASIALHARPRSDALTHLPLSTPARQARGVSSPPPCRGCMIAIDAHSEREHRAGGTLGDCAYPCFISHANSSIRKGTPHYYIVSRRVERAKELLAGTNISLSEIAFAVGFADQSHLHAQFPANSPDYPRTVQALV